MDAKNKLKKGMAGEDDENEEGEEEEDSYEMPREEAIKEHRRLVRILRNGSREELLAEATRQEEELKEIIKGNAD